MLTFTIWCVGISIICAIHPYIPTCQAVSERKSILSAPPYARTGLGSIGEMAAYWKVTPISRAMT